MGRSTGKSKQSKTKKDNYQRYCDYMYMKHRPASFSGAAAHKLGTTASYLSNTEEVKENTEQSSNSGNDLRKKAE
jgi:hypothetical protein